MISPLKANFDTADMLLGLARAATPPSGPTDISVSGRMAPLIEMAAASHSLNGVYPTIGSAPGGFKMALAALTQRRVSGNRFKDFAGVFPLSSRFFPDNVAWEQWAKHAENAAVSQSIPRIFAQRLIGAMIELCDNVDEHSGRPETGIAAYAISTGVFEFVVADCGIGVLESLKKNPKFAAINDAGMALKTAIQDGNSSIQDVDRGLGIGNMFRALVRDEGELRFRSGNYALSIAGSSPNAEGSIKLSEQPWFDGFVISAKCTPALSPDLFRQG